MKKGRQSIQEGETGVYWEEFAIPRESERHYIPSRAHVTFELEGGDVDCALRKGVLDIQGQDEIVIMPSAANAIRIETRR